MIGLIFRDPLHTQSPVQAEGLVDTGASISTMDRRIALQLGLRAISRRPMMVADGSEVSATIYRVEVEAPELGYRDIAQVAAVTMERASTRVLLGRSFLRQFILTYHGGEDLFHWFRLGQSAPEDLDG